MMTDILLRLGNANACIQRGLDLDRDMTFTVHGNGPGSSTSFRIEWNIFYAAEQEIKRLRRVQTGPGTSHE